VHLRQGTPTTAKDAFENAKRVCEAKLNTLEAIENRERAETRYLLAAAMIGLAVCATAGEQTRLRDDGQQELQLALQEYKTPGFLRDTHRDIRIIHEAPGAADLVEPVLGLLENEIVTCILSTQSE
jgi:hypothetical protein